MQHERPRVLLVEDDAQLGPLIERVLDESYEVTRAVDGEAGLRAGLDDDFDVMVIDRRLPLCDGLDLVQALRRHRVVTPILMLTALGSVADRVDGLDAGANDYLVKPFDFDELLARLRALRRTYSGQGPLIDIGHWQFYPESRTVYSPYDGRIQLTVRESALLRMLANEPLRTFTRTHILRAVFENDELPGTVDTYVHYIRRKTDKDIIETVRGEGYRLGQL
jgi:two-component system response regulator QseB